MISQKNAPEVLRKIGTKEKARKSKRNKYYRDTSWPMCACKSFTRLPSKMFQEQNQNSKISVRKSLLELSVFSLKIYVHFTIWKASSFLPWSCPRVEWRKLRPCPTNLRSETAWRHSTQILAPSSLLIGTPSWLEPCSSLSLSSPQHTAYLSVYLCVSLDRLLARSFAIGRPLERSKSAKTTSDPVSKKGPSTTQQGNVKTEANRWRIEDGGREEKNGGANEGRKAHRNHESSATARRKTHTRTDARTHLALIAARRRRCRRRSQTLSFICFAVVAKPPFVDGQKLSFVW